MPHMPGLLRRPLRTGHFGIRGEGPIHAHMPGLLHRPLAHRAFRDSRRRRVMARHFEAV